METIFSPDSPLEIINIQGNNPGSRQLTVTFPDYSPFRPMFTQFRVVLQPYGPFTINGIPITLYNISGNGHPSPQIIDSVNNTFTWNLNFSPATSFPEGEYTSELRFRVEGRLTTGTWIYAGITSVYNIKFINLNSEDFFVRPEGAIELHHVKNEDASWSIQREITAQGSYNIKCGKHLKITGSNISYLYEVDGNKYYSGNGSQNINIVLENSINTESVGSYSTEVVVSNSANSKTIGVVVRIYKEFGITVIPKELFFLGVKNIKDPEWQDLHMLGYSGYSVTKSSFIIIEGGSSGLAPKSLKVKTVPAADLAIGTYNGTITINAAGVSHTVKVTYRIVDFIIPGFVQNKINFTHDRSGISTLYGNDDNKVKIEVKAKAPLFINPFNRDIEETFTKSYFNSETDFWLGNIIKQTIAPLRDLEDVNYTRLKGATSLEAPQIITYLHPVLAEVNYKTVNRETGADVGSERSYNNISFIRGRKPKLFIGSGTVLDYFDSPIRVTPKSTALISFYAEAPLKIEVKKNGTTNRFLYPNPAGEKIFSLALKFSNFAPGDVIDVGTDTGGGGLLSIEQSKQRFIVFPEGKQSYHIAWVTEHNVLQMLEFTGDYEFSSEHKAITTEGLDRYLQKSIKVASDKKQKFKANTGWILKSNVERILSLVDANNAWILLPNKDPIALIPTDAKLSNHDSDREIYEYNVEFLINPSHELENHSF